MCIAMDNLIPETPNFDNLKTTLDSEPEVDQTLVTEPSIDQTLVTEPEIDQTLVTEPAIGQNPGTEPAMEQALADEQMMNCDSEVGLGNGSEQGCNTLSSNSNFKSIGPAEEEEAMTEDRFDSDMYHDAQPPVRDDDVEYDQLDCGLDPYPRAEQVSWSGTWDRNDNKQVENGFSLVQPDLGEVDSAMVGAGLYNLGNTCFLNAMLQCFTHTVPLIEALRSYNHPKPCKQDIEGFCVFCALHNHIELAITRKGKSLSPMKIVDNLNQLSIGFQRYQQEDAHELLQCLLDKLDTCCSNSKTNETDQSLVNRLFGGRLVSKLKCCNCGHCSDTFESLIDLSLEIENTSSLTGALDSFTKVEKIEDEEPQFTCENCKEKVTVEKQLMIDHAPSIAAFHLKRFKNDGSRVEKIDTHVVFPPELDLKPYTSGGHNNNVDLSYSLYAIVVHSGFSPTSGHYFCFVRTAPDAWYRLDDSQVARVSESHVLSWDAYILLYAKNGTPWFSAFMETEKHVMDSKVFSTSPKSVLENVNQISKSSPILEANIMSEVSEEDRREATAIYGLSSNNFKHKGEIGVAKVDFEVDMKLFPSTFGGDDKAISSTSPKSVINETSHVSKSSPILEPNGSTDVNEDKGDAMGTSRLLDNSRTETSLSSPAIRSHKINKNGKFTKSVDFNSSTSRKTYSPIRTSKLSFDDCLISDQVNGAKDDSKVEKKLSPSALRGQVEKRADVNSSTISGLVFSSKPCSHPRDDVASEKELFCKRQSSNDRQIKEACKLVKGMSGSKRRSQLLAIVNSNREGSLNNKKAKMNKPSSNMNDGPSNPLRNPDLVNIRRPVTSAR